MNPGFYGFSRRRPPWRFITHGSLELLGDVEVLDTGPAQVVRLSPAAALQVHGLAGGLPGLTRRFVNVSAADAITLRSESATAPEQARMIGQGGGDVVLNPGDQADVWWDPVSARWRASLVA